MRNQRLSLLALGVLFVSIVGCTRIGPGHVGVVVNLYGTDKGVSDTVGRTGMLWYNPITEQVFEYPTYVQTAVWTKSVTEGSPVNEEITFNDKDGLVMSGDISLSYQLMATKVPAFYVKFRNDDLKGFTHGFLRNVARDAFNEVAAKLAAEDIYGKGKEEFLKGVRKLINIQVNEFGIHLEQLGFVGAPRLPENVVKALNAKIQATQDAIAAENKVRQAEAQAKQRIALAEGEAKANALLTQSLSDKLIQWRNLEITREAVARWDGRRPQVEGSGAGLLLQIPAK